MSYEYECSAIIFWTEVALVKGGLYTGFAWNVALTDRLPRTGKDARLDSSTVTSSPLGNRSDLVFVEGTLKLAISSS